MGKKQEKISFFMVSFKENPILRMLLSDYRKSVEHKVTKMTCIVLGPTILSVDKKKKKILDEIVFILSHAIFQETEFVEIAHKRPSR